MQFASLEPRTSSVGRDRVDHGREGHDDLCNAAAGALTLVSSQPMGLNISDAAIAELRAATWHPSTRWLRVRRAHLLRARRSWRRRRGPASHSAVTPCSSPCRCRPAASTASKSNKLASATDASTPIVLYLTALNIRRGRWRWKTLARRSLRSCATPPVCSAWRRLPPTEASSQPRMRFLTNLQLKWPRGALAARPDKPALSKGKGLWCLLRSASSPSAGCSSKSPNRCDARRRQ